MYRWPSFVLGDETIDLQLKAVWFGALGGVTAAIYGVYTHIQKTDFDPNYLLWYLCKPIMGGIFGGFVLLVFLAGLVSAQGLGNISIHRPEVPFAIAFLAGFSERFTIKMIDKANNSSSNASPAITPDANKTPMLSTTSFFFPPMDCLAAI